MGPIFEKILQLERHIGSHAVANQLLLGVLPVIHRLHRKESYGRGFGFDAVGAKYLPNLLGIL